MGSKTGGVTHFYLAPCGHHNATSQRAKHPKVDPGATLCEGTEDLGDGTYKSLATAAQANDLRKSSFGNRKNGRQLRQETR